MGKKEVGKVLLGIPGALIAVGTFAAIWETPRNWIGAQFSILGQAMANPFVTMLMTLLVVGYVAAIFWCYFEPKPASGADIREAEASKERDRKRGLIDKGRDFAAIYAQGRTGHDSFRHYLEGTKSYAALRGNLSKEYLDKLNAPRAVYGMADGARYEPLVEWFLDDLDRLEKEWGLS